MLRSIFTAIVNAVCQGFAALGRVAAMPFRALAGFLPGGAGGKTTKIDIPQVSPPHVPEAAAPDRTETYRALADAVITWCALSIVDNASTEMTPDLPPNIREWLQGLSRAECSAIIDCDPQSVEAHLRGYFLIPGVRPVQYLTPLREWPPEPSPADDTDDVNDESCEHAPLPIPA